jgi:uncharacterized protein (TIGR02596 family)
MPAPIMKGCWNSPCSRAFSLLELVLVMALVGFLAALGLSGYASASRATALTTDAERLKETLEEARQTAVTQNTSVEMRFYASPGLGGGPIVYCAWQGHEVKADGTVVALSPVVALNVTVALDATAAHSPLLAANTEQAAADAGDPRLNGQTRVFHFLSDGSTDLDPSTLWFVTLRAASAADPAHFPANWACVTLDPTTGRVQVYRP